MINIVSADVHSAPYKQFKNWIIKEWSKVDQLANEETTYGLPLPLLAFIDHQLAGGLSFIHFKSPEVNSDALWINALYVDEKFRGQKIAQKLIDEAVAIAREEKYDCLYVYTNKPQLYKQIGWQIIEENEEDFILKKILK